MMRRLILAIDQGTTSTRVVAFDADGTLVVSRSQELTQYYPRPGWVEHDPDEIWRSTLSLLDQVTSCLEPAAVVGVGITNQRETILVWDRTTGEAVGRAIVWQDRRTAEYCRQRQADHTWLHAKTGLVLDPYFSASKIHWLLENEPKCRELANAGRLACGTIDSYLIFRLTAGSVHATDVTNASRTLLYNIHTQQWDEDLLRYFAIPRDILPDVRSSAADYGRIHAPGYGFHDLPIAGVAGDQQAALFGQCAFAAGESKCTYGTGAFFLLHIGSKAVSSRHRLLTTLAARSTAEAEFALEGSVFVAGAAVQWLRDGLKLFSESAQSEALAETADENLPLIFVPGFVGLGAPHWVPEARGAMFGLTRNTTPAELARATLEGVAFQVADLLEAAAADAGTIRELRADGGMARNSWFLQRQADVLGIPVVAATQTEATSQGAAWLAGLKLGLWHDREALRGLYRVGRRFEPRWNDGERQYRRHRWQRAVAAVVAFAEGESALRRE
jgi:glycerol kinase